MQEKGAPTCAAMTYYWENVLEPFLKSRKMYEINPKIVITLDNVAYHNIFRVSTSGVML